MWLQYIKNPLKVIPDLANMKLNTSVLSFLALVIASSSHSSIAAAATTRKFTPYPVEELNKDTIFEQFVSGDNWKVSHAKRDGEFSYVGKWAFEPPTVLQAFEDDNGLVVKSPAAHHAITYVFDTPFDNTGKDLVLQYEAKFQKGLTCGGSYIKLLSLSDSLFDTEFSNETPYQIMFGPDKCGSTNKIHLIIKRRRDINPNSNKTFDVDDLYEEKHLRIPPMAKISDKTTLYTLIITKDNKFEIRINGETVKAGSLLDENLFTPSFNPPKQIVDVTEEKPTDWVDEPEIPDPEETEKPADWDENAPKKIPDPSVTKPKGWNENAPLTVPDPEAEIPEDWDEEEDGEWVAPEIDNPECKRHGCGKWSAPMIDNPDYKGKWVQPMIENPDYKGEWKPRLIDNPEYFVDVNASDLEAIGGFGFELWTMDKDILFDNLYLGHSIEEAEIVGNATFVEKFEIETELQNEIMKGKLEEEPKKPDEILGKKLPVEGNDKDFAELIQENVELLIKSAQNFLSDANAYFAELVINPVAVITERPNELMIYSTVLFVLGSIGFGIFAIIMVKLTSGLDDTVDGTSVEKTSEEKKSREKESPEKESPEKIEEVELDEAEEEEVKTSSSEKAETTANKRK